jgi:peptidoglycan hydrolase CwlO-like protein
MVTNDALIRTVEHILDNWQWEVEQLCGDMQALQAETARMKKEIAEADAEVRDLTNQVVLFGRTE